MITADLMRKQNLFSDTSNNQSRKDTAFNLFMKKMNDAEKSVMEQGLISEEDVETKLAKV
jgi:hypothetical protein